MSRRRRPPLGRKARPKFLAALALAAGSTGTLFFSVHANANNHGLFNRGPLAQSMVVAPTAYPVIATSGYTVLMPTVATSYVIAPTVQVLPTTWFATTSLLLPMESACVAEGGVQVATPAGNVPELQEIPKDTKNESKPETKPAPAGSNAAEPPLNRGVVSPPVSPLPKTTTKTPPAAAPVESKPKELPKPKEVESKPVEKSEKKAEPKAELPPELPENVNPLPPARPAEEKAKIKPPAPVDLPPNDLPAAKPPEVKAPAPVDLPPNDLPAAKPPEVKAPAPIDLPPNDLPPAKPVEKPSAVAPVAKPVDKAVEKPKDALVPPPAAEIPLPEADIPKLEPSGPAPGVKSPATGPKDKPPLAEETSKKIDVPPPVSKPAELPKLPQDKATPVIPLPDIPPPANGELPALPPPAASLPVPELKDEVGKKLADPGAIKAGVPKAGQDDSATKRDAMRPVISSTTRPALPKPELVVSVKSKTTGMGQEGVRVLFREPKGGSIKFQTTTASAGKSTLEVPEGRWEALVETPDGTLYVLGELVSAQGKVTTASGRALPTLEISR